MALEVYDNGLHIEQVASRAAVDDVSSSSIVYHHYLSSIIIIYQHVVYDHVVYDDASCIIMMIRHLDASCPILLPTNQCVIVASREHV